MIDRNENIGISVWMTLALAGNQRCRILGRGGNHLVKIEVIFVYFAL